MKNIEAFLINLFAAPIETICLHGNCWDGTAAGAILYQVFPNATYKFFAHGSPEFENFVPTNRTLFCDLAPPASQASSPLVFCADHHIGVKDIVLSMEDRGLFADEKEDPGLSGASLAFKIMEYGFWKHSPDFILECPELWENKVTVFKNFANLIAIRDTWQPESPFWDEACLYGTILSSFPSERFLRTASLPITEFEFEVGEIFNVQRLEGLKKATKNAFRTTLKCGKHLVITDYPKQVSDLSLEIPDADIWSSFSYGLKDGEPQQLNISTRARDEFQDILGWCKSMGGGGHTKAAGCRLTYTEESPYILLVRKMNEYYGG